MAQQTPEDSFADEVENRLENLFGEEELVDESPVENPPDAAVEAPAGTPPERLTDSREETSDEADSPLRELKAIVLSIDWEITDEVMLRFVDQVSMLQNTFKGDKVVLVFLQLLGSIGEYIRTNLGKSHPDAFRILSSLFSQLDKVAQPGNLSETERKKVLSAELARYKKLKSRLMSTQDQTVKQKPATASVKGKPTAVEKADMSAAIEEIKQILRSEFQALRKEIELLRKKVAG